MADSNTFYLSWWVNFFLSVLATAWLSIQDSLGIYQAPSAATVPFDTNRGGRWEGPRDTPLIGAASVNQPDGKILIWSAYERTEFSQPDLGNRGKTRTAIIDPIANMYSEELVVQTNHDMFCPGTAYLPDGTVMITGGTTTTQTTIHNPRTNTWTAGPPMKLGRGYHSMTLLGDGSVFTIGGSFSGGIGGNPGEIWKPLTNAWTVLRDVKVDRSFLTDDVYGVQIADNHMWLFTAPNTNKIFHAGPSKMAHWIDVTGNGAVTPLPSIKRDVDQMCGSAVMYDIGKILVLGGSRSQEFATAHVNAYVYDINDAENPQVARVGDMHHRRIYSNAVVLPTGDVIVAGGQTKGRKFSDKGGVVQPEIWNPQTQLFTPLAPMKVIRNYHSSCILTKDAKMVCTGGGLCVDFSFSCDNHLNYEIFTPPYLLNSDGTPATRPSIESVTASVALGDLITVQTDSPCTKFAIIRLGAVTHTINNDLRRIPLSIVTETITTNTYTLRVPTNPNIALPGLYWLYAMNSANVPSVGATVTVTLS